MLSSRLKEETKSAHQGLEKVMIKQIKAIRTPDEYGTLLKEFYGYYKPIEDKLDLFFTDENIPFYSDRRKAATIIEDLTNLNLDTATMPLAMKIPLIDSVAKALGSFYVLEGSTLGGTIIADMLIKHAGMTMSNTRFFNVYAENTTMMWDSFKEKLDNWEGEEKFDDEVIKSADNTFSLFKEWLTVSDL